MEELHYKSLAYQAPNNGGLASHCHKRLYSLGVNVDRKRRWMNKGREGKNSFFSNNYKKGVMPRRKDTSSLRAL